MSRNQREGKFIPGWCYNPAYVRVNGALVQKMRAGKHFDLVKVEHPSLGKLYLRKYRQGAFE